MPQGFYRPIRLQALQIECEYGEIEDKFRNICHGVVIQSFCFCSGQSFEKDYSFFFFRLNNPLMLKVTDMFYSFITVDAQARTYIV